MARILVVDDEESVREFLALLLAGEGFDVETAEDGVEALERIGEHRPDVVLLDLMMPRLDGYGVLERLGGQYPPVVVILSAKADRAKALEAGAIDAVTKPFNNRDLLEAIRGALDDRFRP